jgi:hypothetical protein
LIYRGFPNDNCEDCSQLKHAHEQVVDCLPSVPFSTDEDTISCRKLMVSKKMNQIILTSIGKDRGNNRLRFMINNQPHFWLRHLLASVMLALLFSTARLAAP